MILFPRDKTIGIFRGFREGGLEFHADLALPYQSTFQNIPMHGQLVLVQLETPDEAVLGRITSLSSEGRLTAASGEDFNIRAMRESRPVPEQLREDYLKYRVDIRVLGVLRVNSDKRLTFVASHRRLPHVGSPVAFVGQEILKELIGHNAEGATIGHYALGEYVFTGGRTAIAPEEWVQHQSPELTVKFMASSLVSRRTFVFARAGFGKSNLNKLLFSELYRVDPTVTKRGGKQVPVGTIIFDPDGEYFWPDDKDRPGLADVPHLTERLVIFTSRKIESKYYMSFVAAGVKLDIRTLSAGDVISLALSPEKQDQQNVAKLRAVRGQNWSDLVDLVFRDGNSASIDEIKRLLNVSHDGMSDVEVFAARANLTRIVHMLHDPASRLMDALLAALKEGKLCVVDVSQLRGGPSLVLSGLILRRIFDRNQEEFTKESPQSIPTIAVVEEAQSVLNEKASAAQPYIEWVKEGRKYDLGAMLITQQPGSIPGEILSQGDNWFIFHLLSAADLRSVKGANAHYSDDLLSSLLNEPIPGHGVFWSSVGGRPFPIPFRAMLFESIYETVDPTYSAPAVDTFAGRLRARLGAEVAAVTTVPTQADGGAAPTAGSSVAQDDEEGVPVDFRAAAIHTAKAGLHQDQQFNEQFNRTIGVPWFVVQRKLFDLLPESMTDREDLALQLVTEVLEEVAGHEGTGWHRERRAKKNDPSKMLTWIVKGPGS